MHAQDLFAAANVGTRHHHAAVEAAGAEQRRIEHVRPVGGGDQDDAFVGFEAVHFHQQLVQGLLALVVTTAETGAAMTADGVDFVDEDDAGRILLALLEQVADAAGADADEHLDEIGTGNAEERNIGFAGNGARQQRLAGSRRPDQQHAFGNAPAELLEFLRFAQELDDFAAALPWLRPRPATSLNVTFFCCMESKRALLLPKDSALFPPVCICRIMKIHRAASRMIGARFNSQVGHPPPLASFTVMLTPLSRRILIMSG